MVRRRRGSRRIGWLSRRLRVGCILIFGMRTSCRWLVLLSFVVVVVVGVRVVFVVVVAGCSLCVRQVCCGIGCVLSVRGGVVRLFV